MKKLGVLAIALYLMPMAWARSRSLILSGQPTSQINLKTWLKQNLPSPQENIKSTQLCTGTYMSQHIVQIQNHEKPHIHKDHDLTVFVLEGEGTLILGHESYPVKTGDVIFIPKGKPHHYMNKSRKRTIGYAVFSPPFDGKDTLPVNP